MDNTSSTCSKPDNYHVHKKPKLVTTPQSVVISPPVLADAFSSSMTFPPSPLASPLAPTTDPTTLLSLPTELLQSIIFLLSHGDTVALASSCRNLRAVAKPTIFHDLTLTWPQIDVFLSEDKTGHIDLCKYIRNLKISEPSSWGEWHKNEELGRLVCACETLRSLALVSSGSSSWLKYVRQKLNSKDTKHNTTSEESEPVWPKLSQISVVSRVALESRGRPDNNGLKLPMFNICDLAAFTDLKTLELEGFNVTNEDFMNDFDEQGTEGCEILPQNGITTLHLKNCVWEYPFELQDFGPIRHLSVVYTECYRSFTCKSLNSSFSREIFLAFL